MKNDEIDVILGAGDEILPSSGFVGSVMHAVRSEASAPRPVPFPWKRALPGVVVAVSTLALLVVQVGVQLGRGTAVSKNAAAVSSWVEPILEAAMNAGMPWMALALLVTLASVSFSIRLGSRGA